MKCHKCDMDLNPNSFHSEVRCDGHWFGKHEANKYGMKSIVDILHNALPQTSSVDPSAIEEVVIQIEDMWPRLKSKIFYFQGKGTFSKYKVYYDIFVERWAISPIKSYLESGGYAGLTLAEFLDRTCDERHTETKK